MAHKFDWDKVRRERPLRLLGGEPVSSEHWETGGTPTPHDHKMREEEKGLLAALVAGTRELKRICCERRPSEAQSSRLLKQCAALGRVKDTITDRQLFSASPEMFDARTWLEAANLYCELLESGQTARSLAERFERAGTLVTQNEYFRDCTISESEVTFLRRYLPLYVRLRPPKNSSSRPAIFLQYLEWRFPHERL
jgi:hypothetical protein